MNFLGMGTLEILLILVLAFIFLGPERMIDSARIIGKMVREGRNLAAQVPRVVVEDDDIKLVNSDQTISMTGRDSSKTAPSTPTAADRDSQADAGDAGDDDGPVAFVRQRPDRAQPEESPNSDAHGR